MNLLGGAIYLNKEYKRDGMNNYLVFQKEENASSLEMNMMINNQIEGVIPLEIRSLNGQEYLYYEINSKQSLQRLLQLVELKKEDLRKLFLDMIEILEEGRNYLLQLNHFYLSPETIFLDVSNRKLSLCFVPGYDNNVMKQIEGLIEYFMNHINHQNQEVVVFIYGLYRLSKQDNFTLQDLKKNLGQQEEQCTPSFPIKRELEYKEEMQLVFDQPKPSELVEEEEEPTLKPKKQRGSSLLFWCLIFAAVIDAAVVSYYGMKYFLDACSRDEISTFYGSGLIFIALLCGCVMVQKKRKKQQTLQEIETRVKRTKAEEASIRETEKAWERLKECEFEPFSEVKSNAFYQETRVPEENNLTMVLTSRDRECDYPVLKPLNSKKNDSIVLSHLPYTIGSLEQGVDAQIEDISVSRIHASIEQIGEEYYITDLNSTNGTCVNQAPIALHQRKQIKNGDVIAIAANEYEFVV